MGQSPDSSSYNEEENGIPFFQGNADFGELYPNVRIWCSNPTKIVEKDTILISVRAPIGAVNLSRERCCIGRGLAGIIPKNNYDLKYIYYFLKSRKKELNSKGTGSTFKAISKNSLAEMKVRSLRIEEQERCIKKLDKISQLIGNRREQLKQLDLLIKARFIEMFIDKKYPIKTLDEISLGKGEYGAQSASVLYDSERPRYIRITDINDDGTLNNEVVSSANQDDDEQYRLSYGDFLFARMGATVGKTYMYTEGNQIFAGYLIRYKLNQKIINPRYLFWYTKLDEYWEWVKLNQSGAAQPGINAKKYASLQIPIPPIEFQNQFANFVKNVDKLKLLLDKVEFTIYQNTKKIQKIYI